MRAGAHRYAVKAWPTWEQVEPSNSGSFATLEDARAYAGSLTEPLVDVCDLEAGLIVAARRMVAFPGFDTYETWRTV